MFGDRLKELRQRNSYSMDKLVELYNKRFDGKLNKSTISRYENGLQEPMFTTVKNFAELFGVSSDYLTEASGKNHIEKDSPQENVVVYHRNGKTSEIKLSKEKMDMLVKMIDAIKDDDIDL